MTRGYYADQSVDDAYFQDRSTNPYRSTIAFEAFVAAGGFFRGLDVGALIVDVACGTGSETAWLARQHPELAFLGVDREGTFIDAARARYAGVPNLTFEVADLNDLGAVPAWSTARGVWLSQTLSWLPWWRNELTALIGPQVDRIAVSTLAWDGPIESQVTHFLGERGEPGTDEVTYNVYSIPFMRAHMKAAGFPEQSVAKFEIDIDLEPPAEPGLGSYTVSTSTGERMTFSAWQYLPWHFFLFGRDGQLY